MTETANVPVLPESLRSRNPLRWVSIFGPGAIMASLTIGTGELIFSSRGGAIFGYRILFLFIVISMMKWVLVYSTARHMVLTGAHPFERWLALPGPRGWLPSVMFTFAVVCFPIWVSFHASVIGDLIAGLTATKLWLNGATVHAWGMLVLAGILSVALLGGYSTLERVQLVLVGAMLLAVGVSLILLKPDWGQMFLGCVLPQSLTYPDWLIASSDPLQQRIAANSVWIEASVYVGVVGGASYDYLAYTSFLRNKAWGLSSRCEPLDLAESAREVGRWSPSQLDLEAAKPWLRAPMIDCAISFLVVVVFSAVFVASGTIVLAPQHQIPGDGGFLEYQAQFVTELHPWLYPLYVVGTLLTMFGTLYGTLEVAPPILLEAYRLCRADGLSTTTRDRLRRNAILWSALGAMVVLIVSFFYQTQSGASRPPGLTQLLTPASLFTGVLSCGVICVLNPWMDRMLPTAYRLPIFLKLANLLAGCVFLAIGLRAYWQLGGAKAMLILGGTVALGCLVATQANRRG